MAGLAPQPPRVSRRPPSLIGAAFLLALGATVCSRPAPKVGPVPPAVESLEGYASWRLVRDGAASRSRFSFVLVLPDRGVIEITDPLNRAVSRLFLDRQTAFLVFPGKKAYWRAERTEVMTRLLGFDINPAELAALLTGREPGLEGWALETDAQGRTAGGRRDGLTFLVQEYFEASRVPRTLVFAVGDGRGTLRVARLGFNQPLREEALHPGFLDDDRYREVGWPEIEKWLNNEN